MSKEIDAWHDLARRGAIALRKAIATGKITPCGFSVETSEAEPDPDKSDGGWWENS